MIEEFKNFLIKKGYSEFTPTGNPSTVYDYIKRVEKICNRENISIYSLSKDISFYVDKYGPAGSESEFGKRSHNAFISALKRFEEFKHVTHK